MATQIDPAFKSAWRESQGQPVDSEVLNRRAAAPQEPAPEPVAWLIGGETWTRDKAKADDCRVRGFTVEPIYASPQPANPAQVTDAIRSIVEDALNSAIPEPWEVAEHATQRILAAIGAGSTEKLGRFGHHPDPAIDFEVEVESLQARLIDAKAGISKPGTESEKVPSVLEDIQRAMTFRVGGDPSAVRAKQMLREIEADAISAIGAGGQAAAVKPLDLSNLLEHAFLSGVAAARAVPAYEEYAGSDLWSYYESYEPGAYSRTTAALSKQEPVVGDAAQVNAFDAAVRTGKETALSQPHPADERVVVALREAADRFEEIRVILIEHLEEPQRTAFWKAVNGREFCHHALAKEGRKNG